MHVDWRVEPSGWEMPGAAVLSEGKIFVGSSLHRKVPRTRTTMEEGGTMMCFDSETGKFLWKSFHPKLPPRVNDRGFINSRPWVEGRRAWYLSNRGELVCVDTEGFHDGKNDGPSLREWRLDASGGHATGNVKHFFVGTPTVDKDTIYVGLNNDFEDPQTNAPLYSISLAHRGDATAKAVRWKFQHPEFGSTYSSAAVADGIVHVLSHQAVLFALNVPARSGMHRWSPRIQSISQPAMNY